MLNAAGTPVQLKPYELEVVLLVLLEIVLAVLEDELVTKDVTEEELWMEEELGTTVELGITVEVRTEVEVVITVELWTVVELLVMTVELSAAVVVLSTTVELGMEAEFWAGFVLL
jgi:hypothetical protein